MTKTELSPTQQSLLKSAAGCEDRAIRWPDNLRGGARTKIITALVEAGFAENRKGTLVATEAGLLKADEYVALLETVWDDTQRVIKGQLN